MRRAAIGAGAAVVAAGVAVALGAGGDDPPARAASDTATATAAVERRDLVDREAVAGTLGYAGRGVLTAGASGTLTRLRSDGAVVRRGEWLYEVDAQPTGWLMYGDRPAWRDFTPGMSDGEDVLALERNLKALGYDPGTVDEDWDSDTTDAVQAFQEDRDLTEDGTLLRSELVFRGGAVRIGEAKAAEGDSMAPGKPLADIASTRREVEVDIPADRQHLAKVGARVIVTLPTGRTVRGRVAEIGSIATAAAQDQDPTVPVRVTLRGKAARGGGLDQAPVDVEFERDRAEGALTIPVAALLARSGGGFAVEVPGRGLVPVEPGLFADGYVAVEGDLSEGDEVVVPA